MYYLPHFGSLDEAPNRRTVCIAATQFACTWDLPANVDKAEALVQAAAEDGAQIILLQELFQTPYFCQEQKQELFRLAEPVAENKLLQRFFERAQNSYFNSVAIIDADGSIIGTYRKAHIPDGPGYQEKFYFSPGDTGFRVWRTYHGAIGVAICWDQWFPEAARLMVMQGAEILFYPTAIGSEPQDPRINSYPHWARVMAGHAGANLVPLVASNRIGTESIESSSITFYGGSFIVDHTGAVMAQVGRRTGGEAFDPDPDQPEGFVTATVDLEEVRLQRASWGLFRDRRPDLYGKLLTLDGKNHVLC